MRVRYPNKSCLTRAVTVGSATLKFVPMKGIGMKLVTNGLLLSSFSLLLAIAAQAQNTFPSSGNVGIGTASPQGKLHINGANQNNTATPLFKLTDTNTNQSLAIDNGVGANDFRIGFVGRDEYSGIAGRRQ